MVGLKKLGDQVVVEMLVVQDAEDEGNKRDHDTLKAAYVGQKV